MNWNLARLNNWLLAIGDGTSDGLGTVQGLLDCDSSANGGIADGDAMRWNNATQKFEPWTPGVVFATTTTTTTTTSSSSSTTTTTTG
jgi:hypothetical protein